MSLQKRSQDGSQGESQLNGHGAVILAEPRCPGAAAAALYSGAVCRGEHLFTVAVSQKEPLQSTLAKVSNFIGTSQGRCQGMEKEKNKTKKS